LKEKCGLNDEIGQGKKNGFRKPFRLRFQQRLSILLALSRLARLRCGMSGHFVDTTACGWLFRREAQSDHGFDDKLSGMPNAVARA
jgi:hypothetical protein